MGCFTIYDTIDGAPVWDKLEFEEDESEFTETEVEEIKEKLRWTTNCVVITPDAAMPVRRAGCHGEVVDAEGQEYDCRGIEYIRSEEDLGTPVGHESDESKGVKAGLAMHAWTWILLLQTPGLETASHGEIFDMLWKASGKVTDGPQFTVISRNSDVESGDATVEDLTFDVEKVKRSCRKLLDDNRPAAGTKRVQKRSTSASGGTTKRKPKVPKPKSLKSALHR